MGPYFISFVDQALSEHFSITLNAYNNINRCDCYNIQKKKQMKLADKIYTRPFLLISLGSFFRDNVDPVGHFQLQEHWKDSISVKLENWCPCRNKTLLIAAKVCFSVIYFKRNHFDNFHVVNMNSNSHTTNTNGIFNMFVFFSSQKTWHVMGDFQRKPINTFQETGESIQRNPIRISEK